MLGPYYICSAFTMAKVASKFLRSGKVSSLYLFGQKSAKILFFLADSPCDDSHTRAVNRTLPVLCSDCNTGGRVV